MSDALVILLIDAAMFAAYFLGFVLMCALRGISAFKHYGSVFNRRSAVWFVVCLAAPALLWTLRAAGWPPLSFRGSLPLCALLTAAGLFFGVLIFIRALQRCPRILRAGLLIAMITNGLVACAAAPARLLGSCLSRLPAKPKAAQSTIAAQDAGASPQPSGQRKRRRGGY